MRKSRPTRTRATGAILFILLFMFSLSGCDPVFKDISFPPAASSPYVLPYPVDFSCRIFQAYSNNRGHKNRLAYDFSMPLGSPITASRRGKVIRVENDFRDNDHTPGHNNRVVIRHIDSTLAWYAHLQQNSVLVQVGDSVQVKQELGQCGLSGRSGGIPHLHFEVFQRRLYDYGDAIPISFRNVSGQLDTTGMLIVGREYKALPYHELPD